MPGGPLTLLGSSTINQEVAPSHFSDAGVVWDDLGGKGYTFVVNGSSLVVELSNSANDSVSADAVRVERMLSAAAPFVAVSGTLLNYFEGSGAMLVDPNLNVLDPDSATLAGAAVRFDSGYFFGQDSLSFTTQPGIAGSFNASTGVLTFSGTASLGAYQAILRSVRFTNNSNSPSTVTRWLYVTASDGWITSNPNTVPVSVNPVNDAPTLSALSGVVVNEDAPQQIVNLASISAGGESQTLTVTATSNNTALIPTPVVLYSNPSATGTLRFTPLANASGAATITVRVSDNGGVDFFERTFIVTVNPLNDAPTLSALTTLVINEGAGEQTVNLAGISAGAGGESQTLTVTATSSNTALVPTPTIVYTSPAATGTLRFTPPVNAFGTATITVRVTDDGGTGGGNVNLFERTFTVTINPINDPPTLNALGGLTINENAPQQTVNLSGISAGTGESQSLTVAATSSNTTLIPTPTVQYASPSSTGTIRFTPVAGAFGTASITVRVSDNGGTNNGGVNFVERTFLVTVNPADDPPTLNPLVNVTIDEDAADQFCELTGITAGAGESQSLSVTATSSNTSLIPHPTISYDSPDATGWLKYSAGADKFGNATLTVRVTDQGGGFIERAFTVTVSSVNDAPSFFAGNALVVGENLGPQTVPNWASGISAGPNESGQTLSFLVTTDNPSLFAVQPALSSNGTLTYTPATNATGTAQLTIVLSDNGGTANGGVDVSPAQFVAITVENINLPPTISNINNQLVAENGTLGPLFFTIGDAETAAAELAVHAVSSNTTLIPSGGISLGGVGGNRSITVTPAAGQSGSATITVFVTDGDGASASESFSLAVNAVNHPPVAFPQTVGTMQGTAISFTLAGHDGNPGVTQTLTYAIVPNSGPSNGTIQSFNPATGTVLYVPNNGYAGGDSFAFTVHDDNTLQPGLLTSDPAIVSITVAEDNHAPQLGPIDDQTIVETSTLVFRVQATDPDAGDGLTYLLDWYGPDGQPANQSGLTFDFSTGVFIWTPTEIQGPGEYTAVIRVTDDAATPLEDSETILITVSEHNLRPTVVFEWTHDAWPGTPYVVFDEPPNDPQNRPVVVKAFDFDFPAQGLTFELVSGPGSLVLYGDGYCVYDWLVPPNTPVSTVDVTIRVTDAGSPPRTHDVVVPIAIMHYYQTPYHPPVADPNEYTVLHGQTLTTGTPNIYNSPIPSLLENDVWYSPFGLPLIEIVEGPAHGTVRSSPSGPTNTIAANGHFTYTPAAGFAGLDTFRYRITSNGLSHMATVEIHVINNEPAAEYLAYSVKQGHSLIVSAADGLLKSGPLDGEGDPTAVSLFLSPLHGTLSLNPNGAFTYTPAAGYVGVDSIVYKIDESDAALPRFAFLSEVHALTYQSPYGIVSFSVAPNIPPNAYDDTYAIPFGAASLSIPADGVMENDSDLDNAIDELAALLVSGTTEGSVDLNEDGSFTFIPNGSFDGLATWTYRLTDGYNQGNTATVTIEYALRANDDFYTVLHHTARVVAEPGVLANDTSTSAQPLTALLVTPPEHGTIQFESIDASFSPEGSFTYLPDVFYVGLDSFSYLITDGTDESNVATVWFNVTNTAPVAVSDLTYTVGEDQTLFVGAPGVLANDSDADVQAQDTLYPELVDPPGNGVVLFREDGSFEYTPNPNYTGIDVFVYWVTDGMDYSNYATVRITVQPGSVADLDIADSEENGSFLWLNESLEHPMGAYLPPEGTSLASAIWAESTGLAGYTRVITWNPFHVNVLADNGVAIPTGELELFESDGDHQFYITAAPQFPGSAEISMAVYNASNVLVGQDDVAVNAWTAKLYWVRFTSDHDVLRKGGKGLLQALDQHYSSTEYYWNHEKKAATVNEPMSQTAGTRVKLQLMLQVTGIPVGAQFRIDGTGRDLNGAALNYMTFKDEDVTQTNGYIVIPLEADAVLTSNLVDLRATIDWTLTYAGETKPIAKTGQHRILTTIGAPPINPPAETYNGKPLPADARWATVERILRAQQEVNAAKLALGTLLPPLSPEGELVRLARQMSKQQTFNFDNTLPGPFAWRISATGADCISLAFLVDYFGTVIGMGNFSATQYIATASQNNQNIVTPNSLVGNVAQIGFYNNAYWENSSLQRYLTLVDRQGNPNAFQGTLEFTPVVGTTVSTTTWYIPAGARLLTRAYKDTGTAPGQKGADKVLTVMQAVAWYDRATRTFSTPVLHPYGTQALAAR